MEEQTTQQPHGAERKERHKIDPSVGKHFSSEYQPPAENKSEGHKKKKFRRQMIADILAMPYKFTPQSIQAGVAKQLKDAFGDAINDMTIGEIMAAQQAQKAILKGDTLAFQSLINQALGQPNQNMNVKGEGFAPPQAIAVIKVIKQAKENEVENK